ncbi:MAG: sensor histidine kinase [Omnitrophica WOR_2 bacterium]
MLFKLIRRNLSWKLFFSYLVVILVGGIVLVSAAGLVVPSVFQRHLAAMTEAFSGNTSQNVARMQADLYINFRDGIIEALGVAALAATVTSLVLSWFVSRQVVVPIHAMMRASQRIAEGEYQERVQVLGDLKRGDFDELAQLALSFNRMAERLAQVETVRSQLIADVAHELRTPLTVIKGSMEGLMDGVLPGNDETYLQVYHEADRLQVLVADLQELSRVEAGAYPLVLKPSSARDLVDMVVDRLGRQFEEKSVLLENDVSPALPPVQADASRILQVLTNLVGNALAYTPTGGKVRISAVQRLPYVEISVQDTGIGISVEHLPHIFTRFYRVDPSRSRVSGGSGIGLTVAKHLAEAHGGKIWVDSPGPGQGSTFTFSLPIAP